MELARAIASSSSVEGLEGEDGAEDLVLDDLGVVGGWFYEGRLVEEGAGVGAVSAAYYVLSVFAGALDEALDAGEVVGVDQGRDGRLVLAGITKDVLVDCGVEDLQERLPDGLLHQDSGPGQTDLAAVVVLARGFGGGGVEVGVFEDDEGSLAAELCRKGDEVPGGGDPDQAPRSWRTREGDAPQQGMGDEGGARLLPHSLHDVEDAWGEICLGEEVGEERARERRPLGWLEDHGAASGEGWRGLPGREHKRRVPRGDHGRWPRGHALHAVPRPLRTPVALLVEGGEVRVRAVVARPARDDAGAQRTQQHRHVGVLYGREPVNVLVYEVGEAAQVGGAAGGTQGGPFWKRVVGGVDGPVDLGLGGTGDFAYDLAVDGRDVRKAALARHPLAADEVVG